MRGGYARASQLERLSAQPLQIAQVEFVLGIEADVSFGLAAAEQTVGPDDLVARRVLDDQVVAVGVVSVRVVATVVGRDQPFLKLQVENLESQPHRGVELGQIRREFDFEIPGANQRGILFLDYRDHKFYGQTRLVTAFIASRERYTRTARPATS